MATVAAAETARSCFGCLPSPAGGKFGPFGFLRLVAYAFCWIFLYSCVAIFLHWGTGDFLILSMESLLAVASAFCALCAYSHEMLMNQTTETAKQNKRMSKSLDRLEESVEGLKGVNDKLAALAKSFNTNLDEVEQLLTELGSLSDLEHVCDLLKSFMSVEAEFRTGIHDGVLDREDLIEFLEAAQLAFLRIPNVSRLDVLEIQRRNSKAGIDLNMLKLLANALLSRTRDPRRSHALSDLFLFMMEPTKDRREAVMQYFKVFKKVQWPHGSLQNELRAAKSLSPKDGVVSGEHTKFLRDTFVYHDMV